MPSRTSPAASIVLLALYFAAQTTALHVLGNWLNTLPWVSSLSDIGYTAFIVPIWYGLLGVLPVYLYIRLIERKKFLKFVGLDRTPAKIWKPLCAFFLVIIVYNIASDGMIGGLHLVDTYSFFTIVGIVLCSGFAEEIMFRGFAQTILRRNLPAWAAITVSSLLYTLAHEQWWIQGNIGVLEFSNLLQTFVMGILYGYVFERSGSLWASIYLHTFNNFASSVIEPTIAGAA